jgi:hypothetical protein
MDTAALTAVASFEWMGQSMIFKQPPPPSSSKYPGAQIHWVLEEERAGLRVLLPTQARTSPATHQELTGQGEQTVPFSR